MAHHPTDCRTLVSGRTPLPPHQPPCCLPVPQQQQRLQQQRLLLLQPTTLDLAMMLGLAAAPRRRPAPPPTRAGLGWMTALAAAVRALVTQTGLGWALLAVWWAARWMTPLTWAWTRMPWRRHKTPRLPPGSRRLQLRRRQRRRKQRRQRQQPFMHLHLPQPLPLRQRLRRCQTRLTAAGRTWRPAFRVRRHRRLHPRLLLQQSRRWLHTMTPPSWSRPRQQLPAPCLRLPRRRALTRWLRLPFQSRLRRGQQRRRRRLASSLRLLRRRRSHQ